MRLFRLLVLLLAVAALAACARKPPRQATVEAPGVRSDLDALMYGPPPQGGHKVRYAAPAERRVVPVTMRPSIPAYVGRVIPVADGPYRLDAGDKLRIVVFGQDTLTNTYAVDAAGQVTLPLIGAVTARGLTTQQLSAAIAGRLRAGFLRDPSVAVEVDTYRPFFVLGEVTYPGQYPYVPNITVEAAIAIAGGFTPRAAKKSVTVTRKIQGVPGRYKLPMNYPLEPGDVITIGERWF
jgi:polysaccharide export outer membrane protein